MQTFQQYKQQLPCGAPAPLHTVAGPESSVGKGSSRRRGGWDSFTLNGACPPSLSCCRVSVLCSMAFAIRHGVELQEHARVGVRAQHRLKQAPRLCYGCHWKSSRSASWQHWVVGYHCGLPQCSCRLGASWNPDRCGLLLLGRAHSYSKSTPLAVCSSGYGHAASWCSPNPLSFHLHLLLVQYIIIAFVLMCTSSLRARSCLCNNFRLVLLMPCWGMVVSCMIHVVFCSPCGTLPPAQCRFGTCCAHVCCQWYL